MPELSVIILSYNTRDILAQCLRELAAAAVGLDVEIIVVDNGSTDGSIELLAAWPNVTPIVNHDNAGFAAANNQGLSVARAPFALLLNSDAFIGAAALASGLTVLREQPSVGLAGVRLLNVDGTLQAEHGIFPSLWDDIRVSAGLDQLAAVHSGAPTSPGPVDWVQGACMFVRMAALHDVGPLDTRFFMYSEEVEWCRRCWEHDWQVWYLPDAAVTHIGGASSTGLDLLRRTACTAAGSGCAGAWTVRRPARCCGAACSRACWRASRRARWRKWWRGATWVARRRARTGNSYG